MRNPITQNRARSLRNHTTDTEQYLWRYLRGHQLGGHRFRRQVPIGNYIADFACLEVKLIIELDGGQHQEQGEYDARRDLQMEAQGFRVLRFWDNQVFQETQAVLEVILRVLGEQASLQSACPHPNLPPRYAQGKELKPLPPRCAQGRELKPLPPLAGEGWDGGACLPPPLAGEAWPVLSLSKGGGGEP